MKWFFPKNDGGRESGFHDAGVETFKGGPSDRYLAREIIQNSLDARLDLQRPVQVMFGLVELRRAEIPDLSGLKATFERCAEYFPKDKKNTHFFNRAIALAEAKTITALKAGDFNTRGVIGSDTDRGKDFYNLIRCAGSSAKGSDAGGSFGIGKNAPFAASQMRTVLYSTYNVDKEHIFTGVATLVSHAISGEARQPTGYLGGRQGASIRVKSEIPDVFLRTKTGTDIFVLGFRRRDDWQRDLIYSVLENFWPAIDLRDLVVTVDGQEINADNLSDYLTRFSGEEDFTAHLYYQAYKNPTYTYPDDLPNLRKITLYLIAGDKELPNRIAMIRKPGMVVFLKAFRSIVRFCGVFMCRNETGNQFLRAMEPPRHDTWDGNHPEPGENKKIESEFVNFIREHIRDLVPADESKTISVPGLSRFLPDDDESPDEAFDSGDEHKGESPDRSPLQEKIVGRKIDPKRSAVAPVPAEGKQGEDDEDDTGGPGGGSGRSGEGVGSGVGGGGKKKGGKESSEQSKPTIPIRYRTFATNIGAGVYSVTVQSEERAAKAATLTIWTIGDDRRAPAEIEQARSGSGTSLPLKGIGQVGPVALPNKNGFLSFEVKLREPLRLAMEVVAHEAD